MQNETTTTFPEIWEKMTKDKRDELARALMVEGHCSSPQTVRVWASGRTRPSTYAARVAVAAITSRVTGLDLNESIFAR